MNLLNNKNSPKNVLKGLMAMPRSARRKNARKMGIKSIPSDVNVKVEELLREVK